MRNKVYIYYSRSINAWTIENGYETLIESTWKEALRRVAGRYYGERGNKWWHDHYGSTEK